MAEARRSKPPRWTTLARFEGRITEAQMTKLKALTRKLNVSKRRDRLDDPALAIERITDNTLIRVAVELLFLFGPDLTGYTEADLIESAKSTVKRLRTAAAAQAIAGRDSSPTKGSEHDASETAQEASDSPEHEYPALQSDSTAPDNPWGV